MKEILSIKEAASIMGCTETALRVWIKQGTCPFGQVIVKNDKMQGKYFVFRHQLELFIGRKIEKVI